MNGSWHEAYTWEGSQGKVFQKNCGPGGERRGGGEEGRDGENETRRERVKLHSPQVAALSEKRP